MSKRAALSTGLLALCLLAVSACQVSTPAATPITPSHTPIPIYSPTLTPSIAPFFAPTLPPPPTQTLLPATPTPIIHLIQPGDTLLGLATTYGVPMAAIQLQNGMGESIVLYAG
ncbi:MAG: LysM peptidoglycan-binding domain-containing protein, partial [Anaerolineae bacterium]|nr:LysM peptidoglycan-binding domain-containing protein [Anaerolineae bacterium]